MDQEKIIENLTRLSWRVPPVAAQILGELTRGVSPRALARQGLRRGALTRTLGQGGIAPPYWYGAWVFPRRR